MILPQDFKDFLKLLNLHKVKYMLIGGYAVGYYGYPRATADMDIWIAISKENAKKSKDVLIEFGMVSDDITEDLFLSDNIIRMGLPPMRIEILTKIDGVNFNESYKNRNLVIIDNIEVPLISLEDLKINKKASGRYKDLNDLEHLE